MKKIKIVYMCLIGILILALKGCNNDDEDILVAGGGGGTYSVTAYETGELLRQLQTIDSGIEAIYFNGEGTYDIPGDEYGIIEIQTKTNDTTFDPQIMTVLNAYIKDLSYFSSQLSYDSERSQWENYDKIDMNGEYGGSVIQMLDSLVLKEQQDFASVWSGTIEVSLIFRIDGNDEISRMYTRELSSRDEEMNCDWRREELNDVFDTPDNLN